MFIVISDFLFSYDQINRLKKKTLSLNLAKICSLIFVSKNKKKKHLELNKQIIYLIII